MMQVDFASQSQVDGLWPHVKDIIQKGIDATANDLRLSDLFVACRSGHAFLMVGGNGKSIQMAAIWRFEDWNDGTVFRCLVLGGDAMVEWLPMAFDQAAKTADIGGATQLVATGRKGWLKAIPNAEEIYSTMKMEVANVRRQ